MASKKIMTVANCKQSGSWKASAGSADLYYQRQKRNGKKQLVHPQYNRDELEYDFMIMTVESEWKFNNYIQPIKLGDPSTQNSYKSACKISSFGFTKLVNDFPVYGEKYSKLQWSNIDCISDSDCRKVWGGMTITPRHQCADKNGVSLCMGDSGSPLTKVNSKGETVLIGNVSAGHISCVVNGFPTVYSRNVEPSVHQWIVSNAGL